MRSSTPRSVCIVSLIVAAAAACSSGGQPPPVAPPAPAGGEARPAPSADVAFDAFANRFLDELLQRQPTRATRVGDHRFDAQWPDISPQGEAAYHKWLEETRAALGRLPHDGLSEQNQIDADILDERLRSELFALDELKDLEIDPVSYTTLISVGLDPLVTRSFGTKEQRMASLLGRLDGIPAIVAVARQRLAHPAKVFTETALEQNKGLMALVETQLPTRFAEVPELKDKLTAAAGRAAAALHDLQAFLDKELLPRSDGTFRLGREKFTPSVGARMAEPGKPKPNRTTSPATRAEVNWPPVNSAYKGTEPSRGKYW